MQDLPPLALSVRQPWAWAIVAGHKPIENRSAGAIRAGGMTRGWVCIHAATGLKQDEFQWGHWRLAKHGVTCPRPETLVRGAIIGVVEVVDIIDRSDSEWFGGACGLVLENAREITPIPAPGALGYFAWHEAGEVAKPLPWMLRYDRPNGDAATGDLFAGLAPSFAETPQRPGKGDRSKR
ncbi:hypothetical protein [Pseudaestuariivita sp.]|uniref:hypothetical protein n=1 Tax=Pseudaestuariivita sp. TaxID=2211669 RepID=UPI0040596CEE